MRLLGPLVSLLAGLALLAPGVAAAQNGRAPALSAEAVLLVDPGGRVFFEKNADLERAPASLVKLMTLYLAFEDLESGRADLEEPVTVSGRAASTPRYRMGLRTGETVPLRVLLEGVAIASANDAATALAERLAGDEAAFVDRMNEKGLALGLTATHFANPHGLPDPGQHSNARDLAVLAARLFHDHPASRPMLAGQTFVYNRRVYARHIPLFNDPGGVQALKTGFTREAGYNLAVTAWRGGLEFVMIVLGSRSRSQSFLDAKRVLQYGFVEAGLEPTAAARGRNGPARPVPARRAADRP